MKRGLLIAALLVAACAPGPQQARSHPAGQTASPPPHFAAPSPSPSQSLQPKSQPPPTLTSGTPLPSRYRLWSLSFINHEDAWGLASYSCGRYQCAALFHTRDRWKTWQQVTAPAADVAQAPDTVTGCASDLPCIAEVRFANASVGYLFGSDLFVTRDGARTWRQERSTGVVALEPVGASTFRVALLSDEVVQAEPVAGGTWQTLPTPHLSGFSASILHEGTSRLYVINTYRTQAGDKTLITSSDGGATWQQLTFPCGSDQLTGIAAAPKAHLLLMCFDQTKPSGDQAYVLSSDDGGLTYAKRRPAPYATGDLAAGSGRVMAAVDILHGVLTSTDDGLAWQLAFSGTASAPDYSSPWELAFEDGVTAHFIFPGTTVRTLTFR